MGAILTHTIEIPKFGYYLPSMETSFLIKDNKVVNQVRLKDREGEAILITPFRFKFGEFKNLIEDLAKNEGEQYEYLYNEHNFQVCLEQAKAALNELTKSKDKEYAKESADQPLKELRSELVKGTIDTYIVNNHIVTALDALTKMVNLCFPGGKLSQLSDESKAKLIRLINSYYKK